ncbi:hypothetical protein [Caldibacillus thermoamylovorans]|uniref:hypothetical protein n=1 Tax=Caldibacillus thermoamylovorans TaxID=35841 RepID=UPI000BA45010|nr:hypothetical protein [Caldibacillus thermoamylovorans]PAC36894.1 hypothetical protein CEJ87_04620 [Caldifermentibacillus hisashii]
MPTVHERTRIQLATEEFLNSTVKKENSPVNGHEFTSKIEKFNSLLREFTSKLREINSALPEFISTPINSTAATPED